MKKVVALVVMSMLMASGLAFAEVASSDVAMWAGAKQSKAGKEYHQAFGTLDSLKAFIAEQEKAGNNMFSINVNPRTSKKGNKGYDLFLGAWKGKGK